MTALSQEVPGSRFILALNRDSAGNRIWICWQGLGLEEPQMVSMSPKHCRAVLAEVPLFSKGMSQQTYDYSNMLVKHLLFLLLEIP